MVRLSVICTWKRSSIDHLCRLEAVSRPDSPSGAGWSLWGVLGSWLLFGDAPSTTVVSCRRPSGFVGFYQRQMLAGSVFALGWLFHVWLLHLELWCTFGLTLFFCGLAVICLRRTWKYSSVYLLAAIAFVVVIVTISTQLGSLHTKTLNHQVISTSYYLATHLCFEFTFNCKALSHSWSLVDF